MRPCKACGVAHPLHLRCEMFRVANKPVANTELANKTMANNLDRVVANAYKHRDPAKRRAYMKAYMAKKRKHAYS